MKRLNQDYINACWQFPLLIKEEITNNTSKNLENPSRILIINSSLIGDFIVSLHAIRSIIKQHKQAKIDIVVSSSVKPIAERIIGINDVFVSKSICNRKIDKLDFKKTNFPDYDLVIPLIISADSYDLLKRINYRSRRNCIMPIAKLLHHNITTPTNGKFKQWRDVFFEIIEKKKEYLKFNEIFNFSESDYNKIKTLDGMKEKGRKIIIHTGSGWNVKLWENDKWVELLKKINNLGKFKFIFVGGTKEEKKSFGEISSRLNFKTYSLIGKINLSELMLVLRSGDYFIGIDSGPRNMAHLADIPSISLLGPGPKNHAVFNSRRDVVIDKSDCYCSNLFCYKKITCIQKINVEEVFNGFKKVLKP